MKRVKQYRIRLTEEEDELLKQKAKESGLSVADLIRLGIKYQIEQLETNKTRDLWKSSIFIQNWEQNFDNPLLQEFGKRWQDTLKYAYLLALKEYKNSVCYVNERFEIFSSVVEVDEGEDANLLEEQPEPETVSEQEINDNVCRFLTKFLGGEWRGDEWIVQMMISGLKVDLANSSFG